MRRALRWFFFVVGALSLAAGITGYVARWTGGPIGPISGGALRGTFTASPLPDPATLARRREVQLQVNPAAPRSVNVWVLVVDGIVYVPSSLPEWKIWPAVLANDPHAVLRVDSSLYDVSAHRVEDPALVAQLRQALERKYGTTGGDGWFFRLDVGNGGAAAP
jgi:hypothetical protein